MPEIIKKIVVKDIGVLRAFDTPGSPRLAPLTLIYAANGRGKTTLTSILKSSATGNVAVLKGRTTLGLSNPAPEVTLGYDSRAVRFANGRWTAKTAIEVFDAEFIAENLFAGEAPDLQHDRHLFSVILGAAGVKLAKQQEIINRFAKSRANALKDAEKALQNDLPTDISPEEFFALSPSQQVERQISEIERELKSLQDTDRVARMKGLAALPVPTLDQDINAILARTVEDIDTTARSQMAAHFSKFQLGRQAEGWIKFGLEHLHGDDCPFCGKSGVDDLGLVSAYGQIFGEAYQRHFDGVKRAAEAIEKACGPEAIAEMEQAIASNAELLGNWTPYLDLSGVELVDIQEAIGVLREIHNILKLLLERKRQEPLSIIEDRDDVARAMKGLTQAQQTIGLYNGSAHRVNTLIQSRTAGTRLTEQQLRVRLANLVRRQRRRDPGVQARVDDYLSAKRRDARARAVRTEIQKRLKAANIASAEHYHEKVNFYLGKFGATFRISEISNSMSGNTGSVDYGLIVRGHPVARNRGRENFEEATFANTLSTGDKTTLAFAFFLAGLDRIQDLSDRIIVFDDPLSSHDTHRKGKTTDYLAGLCGRAAQVIVLSHDAHFLRLTASRCNQVEKVVYEIKFDGAEEWSKAQNADLDILCESYHALQMRKLRRYQEHREGEPSDVAPAVRKVLETHYRAAYSGYFRPSEDLGDIVRSIRAEGSSHPCWPHVNDLDACNVGTLFAHHGDDPRIAGRAPPDDDEMHRLVTDCLTLVNAIRPDGGRALRAVRS